MPETNLEELPASVLFACNLNAVRSPMAAGIMRYWFGSRCYVDSIGVRIGELDPFAVSVMDEIGIDISAHTPKSFEDLMDSSFDMIVSLTPEAHHQALELTRTMAIECEYWPTFDPTITAGSREQIMESYRQVRDALQTRIQTRFGTHAVPSP